jgi:dTDP-4-amino-4,6-dideoxygalactose transaminase
MKVPFLDLPAQHRPILDESMEAIRKVVAAGSFILGEEVSKFEAEFAEYCSVKFAVGADNGLSALKMALEAYGIGAGDEVIVPANTFVATAAAVSFVGAKVVLVDVAPGTYNFDLDAVEAAITARTKALMPVHLYGIPVDMDRVMKIAAKHNLIVIEDACQAHGSYFNGKRAGSFGHAAGFSFYPGKNLGAPGDGGALTTNVEKIAEAVKVLRNCGSPKKYYHTVSPYNHRLDTVHAAVLRIKLRHLDNWNAARRHHAEMYNKLFENSGVITPKTPAGAEPVWHLYVIRTEHRDALKDYLAQQGIGTLIHYPIPVHMQPYYASYNWKEGMFPLTEKYANQILSLPMFAELTDEQIEYTAFHVKKFVEERDAAIVTA